MKTSKILYTLILVGITIICIMCIKITYDTKQKEEYNYNIGDAALDLVDKLEENNPDIQFLENGEEVSHKYIYKSIRKVIKQSKDSDYIDATIEIKSNKLKVTKDVRGKSSASTGLTGEEEYTVTFDAYTYKITEFIGKYTDGYVEGFSSNYEYTAIIE